MTSQAHGRLLEWPGNQHIHSLPQQLWSFEDQATNAHLRRIYPQRVIHG